MEEDSDLSNPNNGSLDGSASQKDELIREINSLQGSFQELSERVDKVQAECDRKKADNETLQTYVNNLTRQNMLITSAK
ncbi:uncharacterized protein MELLADRAFT_73819 [Melampsora larici-populina 98AG31]|uniref:Uncharacterized protein n=1 Tax=Melampsora larici-populina (strain 98AG31 / pathotype 3-4-7) TaxID=747676 RepID=F4R3N7_MELLP|nr:uncharacterized protein MELLADRAFT_73819 [Melampsora larici-populina 98AG31]EGG13136.1 hypothetical protein MELLADRAFT_73819 [Melampsora larici-populina 98AG31]